MQQSTKCLTLLEVVFLLQKGGTKRPFQFDSDHWNELVDSDSWDPMILKEKKEKEHHNRDKKPKERKFKTPGTGMLDYEENLKIFKKGGSGEFWIP